MLYEPIDKFITIYNRFDISNCFELTLGQIFAKEVLISKKKKKKERNNNLSVKSHAIQLQSG